MALYDLYILYGGDTRIRTGDQSFADSCLTTWLCRQNKKMEQVTRIELVTKPWQGFILPLNYTCNSNTLLIYQKIYYLSRVSKKYIYNNKYYALEKNLIPFCIALFLKITLPYSISLLAKHCELLVSLANSEIKV